MITFFVPGVPVAKGSAKAFYSKKAGRAFVTQSNLDKQRPWVSMISVMAEQSGVMLSDHPVSVTMLFNMPRPKSHFGSKGQLKPSAPILHTSAPDIDKLERAVLDALTTIAYHDDRQVCETATKKLYSLKPGVLIHLGEP